MSDEFQGVELAGEEGESLLDLLTSGRPRQAKHLEVIGLLHFSYLCIQPLEVDFLPRYGRRFRFLEFEHSQMLGQPKERGADVELHPRGGAQSVDALCAIG